MEISAINSEEIEELLQKNNSNLMILWSKPTLCSINKKPKILKQYQEFQKLFKAQKPEEKLFNYRPYDHEIKLQKKKYLKKKLIYLLFTDKLDELRRYLNKNKKMRLIWELQSPAEYLIIFIPKKDRKLRLCINYWKLNDIIIKNSYPLLLISEMQDQLQRVKIFIKIDISGAYNQIRIKEKDK